MKIKRHDQQASDLPIELAKPAQRALVAKGLSFAEKKMK